MENTAEVKKGRKEGGSAKNAPVRVSKETRRKILTELARLNKKDFGRRVKANDLISLALTLVTSEHYAKLQDMTLSNADRLERRFQDFVKRNGPMTKDSFLGMLLGEGAEGESAAAPSTVGEAGLL